MTDAPIAGWYPDPRDAASWRWWNGTDWTDDVVARPAAAEAHVDAPRRPADWGWDNTPVLAAGGAATLVPARSTEAARPAKTPKAKATKAEKAPRAEKPAKAERATVERAASSDATASTSTVWIWILVFSPVIYGVLVAALRQYVFPLFADQASDTLMLVGIGILVLPLVPLWVFAELDARTLRKRGFEAPSVLWMLLLPPIAYFVRRWMLLRRSGARSFAPSLALFIVFAVLIAAGVVLANTILALLPGLGVTLPTLPG